MAVEVKEADVEEGDPLHGEGGEGARPEVLRAADRRLEALQRSHLRWG